MHGEALARVRAALDACGCLIRNDRHDHFSAQCPAHDDTQPSLSVRHANDRVLLRCHRGCDQSAVIGALGLTWRDLFDEAAPHLSSAPVREFDYTDPYGGLLGTVVRVDAPKSFRPLNLGEAGWQLGATDQMKSTPYRVDEVIAAIAGKQAVWIVEGERDADTLWTLGLAATCNLGGAGKWTLTHAGYLAGAQVVNIIADADDPGLAHAWAVAATLPGRRCNVFSPALGYKDITAHLTAGLGLEALSPIAPPTSATDDPDKLWAFSPELATIREWARAQMAAPWAVLACVLVRVLAQVPPSITIPAIIGSRASLNSFIAIVGTSAAGKGAALGVSRDCLGATLTAGQVTEASPGSGEGIAHAYMHRNKEGLQQHCTSAIFRFDEVKTLTGLKGRTGATIVPELCKAWSGEQLGFLTADPSRRMPVPENSYRLSLLVSVQPDNAQGLLEEQASGFPQRFLWVDALDPEAPDVRPSRPQPLRWSLPASWVSNWEPAQDAPDDWATAGRMIANPSRDIDVCAAAIRDIEDSRRQALRTGATTMDGHALLARLKAAVALAALHHRGEVDDQMWELSGLLMAHSESIRARVQGRQHEISAEHEEAGVHKQIRTQVALEEHQERRVNTRITARVLAHLSNGALSRSEIRRRLAARDRSSFDAVIADLVSSGRIGQADTDSGSVYNLLLSGPVQ